MITKEIDAIVAICDLLKEFIADQSWDRANWSFEFTENSSCSTYELIWQQQSSYEGIEWLTSATEEYAKEGGRFLLEQYIQTTGRTAKRLHFTLDPDGRHEFRFDEVKPVSPDAPPQDISGGLSIAQQLANFGQESANVFTGVQAWLGQHLPEIEESLQPGATPRQLQNYANKLGVVLPQDFVHLYHWHNGQKGKRTSGVFYGLHFMSLKESLAACEQDRRFWKAFCDAESRERHAAYASSTPQGHVRVQYCNPYWLPFAHDHGGNYLGIDLSPDSLGTAGQVINFGRDEDHKVVIANSLGAFMRWLLAQWQAGNATVRREDDGGRSFNTRWPDKAHFLDAIKQMFPRDGSTFEALPRETPAQAEAEYLERCRTQRDYMEKMAADELGLTTRSAWQLNIQTGSVTFTTAGGKTLHCQVQILGRYHQTEGQLHWAWDQAEWPLDRLCAARALQDSGVRYGWERFTRPTVTCSEEDAWSLVSAAIAENDVEGLFRASDGNTVLYLGYATQN